MLVSDGKTSKWRNDKVVELVKNGDFIDIWYTKNGEKQFLAVDRDNLSEILKETEQGASRKAWGTVDEDRPQEDK